MRVVERDDGRFVECAGQIERIDDVIELILACGKHDSSSVLIDGSLLPPAFFDLSSGFAGEVVQKLYNYGIRAAAVMPPSGDHSERFKEFVAEARRGGQLRVFDERADAELWLCSA